jgi:hypothetical protein
MFQYLAHNLKLRKFLESSIIAWFKQWNKLTTASSFDKEISILSNRKAAAFALENFQNATYFTSKSQLYSFVGNQILLSISLQKSTQKFNGTDLIRFTDYPKIGRATQKQNPHSINTVNFRK